jgi:hypothetical protein
MSRRLRYLRIVFSAFCGLACVLLLVLWVRSLNNIDRLTWYYSKPKAIQLGASSGQIEFYNFVDQPGIVPASTSAPAYLLWQDWFYTMRLYPGGVTEWGFRSTWTQNGFGTTTPDWFVILMLVALGAAPWLKWQFSLRTFLIAMTLVAVALGAIVYAVR